MMVYRTMLPLFLFSFVFPLVVLFFGFVFSVRILWSLSLFVSVPVSVCLLLSLSLSTGICFERWMAAEITTEERVAAEVVALGDGCHDVAALLS
jgi:hypothetical protein